MSKRQAALARNRVEAGSAAGADRTWSITTTDGDTVTGYLPAWASVDPSATGVPPHRLGDALSDINHHLPFDGTVLTVDSPDDRTEPPEEEPFFRGGIDCNPYAEDPEPKIPVANFEVLPDYWAFDLGPDEVTRISKELRALADRFDNEVVPALIAARTDWTAALKRRAS